MSDTTAPPRRFFRDQKETADPSPVRGSGSAFGPGPHGPHNENLADPATRELSDSLAAVKGVFEEAVAAADRAPDRFHGVMRARNLGEAWDEARGLVNDVMRTVTAPIAAPLAGADAASRTAFSRAQDAARETDNPLLKGLYGAFGSVAGLPSVPGDLFNEATHYAGKVGIEPETVELAGNAAALAGVAGLSPRVRGAAAGLAERWAPALKRGAQAIPGMVDDAAMRARGLTADITNAPRPKALTPAMENALAQDQALSARMKAKNAAAESDLLVRRQIDQGQALVDEYLQQQRDRVRQHVSESHKGLPPAETNVEGLTRRSFPKDSLPGQVEAGAPAALVAATAAPAATPKGRFPTAPDGTVTLYGGVPVVEMRDAIIKAAEAGAAKTGFTWRPRLISEEYATARRNQMGRAQLAIEDTQFALDELKAATKGVTADDLARTREFMMGEVDDLPPSVQPHAAKILGLKQQIHDLSQAQVQRGILSKEVAKEYERGYLARVFERDSKFRFPRAKKRGGALGVDSPSHYAKDYPGAVLTLPTSKVAELARDFDLRLEPTQTGKRTVVKFKDVADRDAFLDIVRSGEVDGVTARKIVDSWDGLTKEQRAELGEITDPSVPLAFTVHRASMRVARYDFLKSVADGQDAHGLWALDGEPAPGLPQRYHEIRADGPLKGKWLRQDILEDLAPLYARELTGEAGASILGSLGESGLGQFWNEWLSGWKSNKTVMSPRTAARQLYSVPWFVMYGAPELFVKPEYWVKAAKVMKRGTPEWNKYHRSQVERGIVGTQFSDVEVRQLLDIAGKKEHPLAMLGRMTSQPWKNTSFARGAGKFYNLPDEFTRRLFDIYYQEGKGLSPDMAAREVNKWTPNYREVGKTVDTIRKSPLGGPFFTFKAEMYRIQKNAAKERPLRLASSMMFTNGVRLATGLVLGDMMGAFGEDEELLELERKALEQQRGLSQIRIPEMGAGMPRTFDVGFIDPNTETRGLAGMGLDAMGVRNPLSESGKYRPELENSATPGRDKLVEALGAFGFEASPGLSFALKSVYGVDPETGRDVNLNPATLEGIENIVQEIMPGLAPGGRDLNRIIGAATGRKRSRFGVQQDLPTILLDSLAGITTTPFDAKLEREKERMLFRLVDGYQAREESKDRRRDDYGFRMTDLVDTSREAAREHAAERREIDDRRKRRERALTDVIRHENTKRFEGQRERNRLRFPR